MDMNSSGHKPDEFARAVAILRAMGIEMKVGACGCCASPWISMKFRGETIIGHSEGRSLDTTREVK